MQKIKFYRTSETYGCFSNFAPYEITIKNQRWPTSEHYFQAQKFSGTEYEEYIRLLDSPMKAASFGRRKELPLRQDWDQVKVKVMREALTAKFGQHPELAAVLEATGNALIVEHTENDKYWGDGGDGSGENMLGRLLMEIRKGLRSKNRSIPIEQIDPALAAEASRNPGGYVYVIDEEVSRSEHGPPEAIRGCYKVDNEGKITGEFIVNPNYRGAGNR